MLNLTNNSLENYEIIKEIGKGSFSIVYLVKKYSSQKEFALKKVNIIKLTSKERQNSLKEVNFLSEIKDPNVIGYEESFYDKNFNHLFLIMEYAPYGDLSKILQKRKKTKDYFTENELLNMYLQIASGLKAIHAKQIIHRDLKSANIFITQKTKYDELILKIGDFNVSKKIDYLNLKNTQTGTPYYASPEIWENKPYDFKSDIWSLGCLFYEIASFNTPFKGNNMKELYRNILKGNMAPLPKQYSNKILKIISMCLRQDANLRPNINDIKFYIENLKLEQHFKKVFDENFLDINNYNHQTNNNNFGIKRQTSYIKQSGNLILDNYYSVNPEFENMNLKLRNELTPIKQNHNNISNNLPKNRTPIKLAGLLNINLNLINNNINNNRIKENKNNNIYKTDNSQIIPKEQDIEKKYFNIKKMSPPFRRLRIINTEFEEKIKIKEESKDNNVYKEDFNQKFNNIKNPLIQRNSKSSINNTQSIPEIINTNSEFKNQKNEKQNLIEENIKDVKEQKLLINEISNIGNKIYNKINYHYKKEKEKNLITNDKIDRDLLILLKPNKLNFKTKQNNLSTLNLHKRTDTSLLTHNINKNKDLFKESDNNNKLNISRNLSKIKLKPIITPLIRSITPFNDKSKKERIMNNKNKLRYNFSNHKLRSLNDNLNEINNSSKINNETKEIKNDKKSDKKIFMRKLNFDKSKFNLGSNLKQIKTKFTNFIKPNLKNFEIMNQKTEI